MSAIVLLDTSIYMNVLDIPGWNQHRGTVLADFATKIDNSDIFLLPMAAIWETGNHIARLADGATRRKYAELLVKDVHLAITGQHPYRPTHFPDREEFLRWLETFPDYAMRNKTPSKTTEGISLSDHSIINEFNRTCEIHPLSNIYIWSLDLDLNSYVQCV